LKAITACDPRLIRQAQLESRLSTLERARAVHQRTIGRLRDHVATGDRTPARFHAAIREGDTLLVARRAAAATILTGGATPITSGSGPAEQHRRAGQVPDCLDEGEAVLVYLASASTISEL
jgi:uncharacterized coiled-coil protein SlyX